MFVLSYASVLQKFGFIKRVDKIDYFIESAPYGFLFTSRKTLETNE